MDRLTVRLLEHCIARNQAVILWGPPGTGKTSIVTQLARRQGRHLETVIASLRDPTELCGLQVIADGRVQTAPPAWASNLVEAARAGRPGLLFFDEVSTAPPSTQRALLRVVLERVVGDLSLPETVAVVAAANPPDEATGTYELTEPLANRFVHIEWRPDLDAWLEYMAAAPDARAGRALVSGYVARNPGRLFVGPRPGQNAFPSPRTWEKLALLLEGVNLSEAEFVGRLVAGTVGAQEVLPFLDYVGGLVLPDPAEVLADPAGFELPARHDRLYGLICAVYGYVYHHPNPEVYRAAWVLTGRLREVAADLAARLAGLLVRLAERRPGLEPDYRVAAELAPVVGGAFGADPFGLYE